MNRSFALLLLIALAGASVSEASEPAQVPGRQSKNLEGWTVRISDALLEKEKAATERALELLAIQLQEVNRTVPATAVVELKKVPLWISPEYAKVQPRAEYHPNAGWLRENNRDPAMEKAIEFTNVRIFERETKRMPNFALHELAHAFHDRVLRDGYNNADIKSAFENAKKQGLYENVERRFGDGRTATGRAYALTSPMEYFAECSEAYYSTNDFFPYTREQLAKYDPVMFALLGKLWLSVPPKVEQKEARTPPGHSTELQVTSNSKSSATQAIPDASEWKHSGSVWILTTPEGANLPADATLEGFPLLIRLQRDCFDFREFQSQGEDLRFFSSKGEALAYQIEHWDAERGLASVWVRIPKITGNSRQEIRLRWGNPKAIRESNGSAVFHASNGYLSVWHMSDAIQDEVGTLTTIDKGTTATLGMIGIARHLPGGKGLFGGDQIANYPTGSSAHSTEVWFRPLRPNSTVVAWGNEQAQGKVVMHFRSPPHVRMDCYFSGGNVNGQQRTPLGEWTHAVHTYQEGESKLYVNGILDAINKQGPPLNIRRPARLWIGGWYHNYDFVGDVDEVRISQVVRSADWIKLQYENQKPNQTVVGPLVQPGREFSVSPSSVVVREGQSATFSAQAGGAQQVQWILQRDGQQSIVAANRRTVTIPAGRVTGPQTATLTLKAIYATDVKTKDVAITITEEVPEPDFELTAPTRWDGRQTIEVVAEIKNLAALRAAHAEQLNIAWTVDDVAVIKEIEANKLILKRAQGSGRLRVTALIDNGGEKIVRSVAMDIKEPSLNTEEWLPRPLAAHEQPEDNQFLAREGRGSEGQRTGTLVYAGTLTGPADSVFVRVFANDKLHTAETGKLKADKSYSLSVKLKADLVKYRTEFGTKSGDNETILHTAKNIVCGDVYLIIGQSNAVATDFGKENPQEPNEWVRTFGATAGDAQGSRSKLWAKALARSPGGKSEIGYWGLELGRRLVESEHIPICLINGAVGGTRIDQHQRNNADPTDVSTIYGRLLWRVQQAKLTHGIRAILWHQGENDQGADGPTGGYGYETYRSYFVDLAASWKSDYPNLQHYYIFQIWPKACAMGINGSDNRLREVQRTLPELFSNLSVMSTLGIKPPGGCHFPAAGYAEFARFLHPMMQSQLYDRKVASCSPPNLKRAFFTTAQRNELVLEFDSEIKWSDNLVSQFHLDGEAKQVVSGAATAQRITLTLKGPSKSTNVTYLDSANWNPDNLLYGQNGLAALTFCEVPIALSEREPLQQDQR